MKWVEHLRPFAQQSLELDVAKQLVWLDGVEYGDATALYRSVRWCESLEDAKDAAYNILATILIVDPRDNGHLRRCSRLSDFGSDRWSALEVCVRAAVHLHGVAGTITVLQLPELLLSNRAECRSCLRILAGLLDADLLRVAPHISPSEPNCDFVLRELLDCTNWFLNNARREALAAAAIECESPMLFKALLKGGQEELLSTGGVLVPGNGPVLKWLITLQLWSGSREELSVLAESERYVAQCAVLKLDPNAADDMMEVLLSDDCTRVHPVTLLALMQSSPRLEAQIRVRSNDLAQKLLHARAPALAAWLLDQLGCDTASLATDASHAGPLYSWHLASEERVAHLLPGNAGLVWRSHTHRFFPPEVRQRVRWLLCLLRRIFPAAPPDIRKLIIENVSAQMWYERRLGNAPSVDLDAPWKVISIDPDAAKKETVARKVMALRRERRSKWIEAGCVAACLGVAMWLIYRKKEDT
jgi:hypothetical protein